MNLKLYGFLLSSTFHLSTETFMSTSYFYIVTAQLNLTQVGSDKVLGRTTHPPTPPHPTLPHPTQINF